MSNDGTNVPDQQLQGELELMRLGVENPLLGGRKLGMEGARAIIDNFADGDEDLLVTFLAPGEEPLVFQVVAMRVHDDSLQALIRAESPEEMARFADLIAVCAPGNLGAQVELGKNPDTGEVPDPVVDARVRGVRVDLVAKH